MGFAKTLKQQFRVGGLDLPGIKKRYTSSREEEEVDAQMCLCGKAIESRTVKCANRNGRCYQRK